MSTQRCDSANKRTRFAPITTPARSQYTLPSTPFLSRSAAEMQNPSPYDSGYDSNFSSASGPGQPPSSRGSSDIDDQVEHYIRDQRVATIASTLPFTPSQDTPTQPISHPRHFNQHQLNIVRAIAEHHLAIANDPEHDHPPPLIPDSDTEDEVDTDDTTSVPPLIRLDANNQPNVTHANDLPITQPHAPPLMDDERNNLLRNYMFGISHHPAAPYTDTHGSSTSSPPPKTPTTTTPDSGPNAAQAPRHYTTPPLPHRYPTPNYPTRYNPNSHGTSFVTAYLISQTNQTHSVHRPPSTAYTLLTSTCWTISTAHQISSAFTTIHPISTRAIANPGHGTS